MIKFIRFIFTRKFWINIGVYVLLLFALIYGLFAYLNSYTLHGKEIKVPHLRGYHISEIESILSAEKLTHIIVDSIYVENENGGMVTEQIPDSGFMVKEGRKIYLTVSAYNTPKIPLPNLKFDDKRNVIAQLTAIGFKIDSISYIPSECEDCLEFVEINGKRIKPGARIDIGSSLDLIFGGGKSDQFTSIPNLLGMSWFDAEETIKQTGLKISVVVPDKEFSAEDTATSFVYKQIPEASIEPTAYLGSSIQIFVSTEDNKRPTLPIEETPNESPEEE